MSQNLNRFFRIYLRLAALTLVVCTLLRIVLLFNEQTSELASASSNGSPSSDWAP